MDQIITAITAVADQSGQIQTAILTILGVLVTVGLAWAIVSGMRK